MAGGEGASVPDKVPDEDGGVAMGGDVAVGADGDDNGVGEGGGFGVVAGGDGDGGGGEGGGFGVAAGGDGEGGGGDGGGFSNAAGGEGAGGGGDGGGFGVAAGGDGGGGEGNGGGGEGNGGGGDGDGGGGDGGGAVVAAVTSSSGGYVWSDRMLENSKCRFDVLASSIHTVTTEVDAAILLLTKLVMSISLYWPVESVPSVMVVIWLPFVGPVFHVTEPSDQEVPAASKIVNSPTPVTVVMYSRSCAALMAVAASAERSSLRMATIC